MLTRFLGRNDAERRIIINSIAPHWDGDQGWLMHRGRRSLLLPGRWSCRCVLRLLCGDDPRAGVFVSVRSVLTSASEIKETRWRNMSTGHLHSYFVPPLVIGVAFGNLCRAYRSTLMNICVCYAGNFFQLLNPFGLLRRRGGVGMIITQAQPICKCVPWANSACVPVQRLRWLRW